MLFGFARAAPYLVGFSTAIASVVLGALLLRTGRRLQTSGEAAGRSVRAQALVEMAHANGGRLTAESVARTMGTSVMAADAELTAFAKDHPDYVDVDIDDNGGLIYRWRPAAPRVASSHGGSPGGPSSRVRLGSVDPAQVGKQERPDRNDEAGTDAARDDGHDGAEPLRGDPRFELSELVRRTNKH